MIDLKKICKDKGLRMTEQRNIIADVVSHIDGHPDVNEILDFSRLINSLKISSVIF